MNNLITKNYRCANVDVLKLIASFGVVVLHTIGLKEGWGGSYWPLQLFLFQFFLSVQGIFPIAKSYKRDIYTEELKISLNIFALDSF